MAVQIERDVYPKTSKLAALYEAVGWSAYTQDEASLTRAVAQSLAVVTAWEGEERLVGLARAVGDGESVLFIQDVLVHPAYQGHGIGSALVRELCAMYPAVRQKLLLADNAPCLAAFYRNLGLTPAKEKGMEAWML